MIGTWHPLDSSSSFVRNIFGSSDRVNDNAQSNSQPFPRATSVLEDFLDIMNNDSRSDESKEAAKGPWMVVLFVLFNEGSDSLLEPPTSTCSF